MNKFLPKTELNPKGFTLVELLVVIVILAILGVVGVTLFSSTQISARDAKRKEDIGAIADAMEVNYRAGSGYATVVQGSWFADGTTPSNPSPNGSTYVTHGVTTAGFTFCALLENTTGGNFTNSTGSTAGAGAYFCKKNAQ